MSQREFTIQECQACNFRFTNPRPIQEELANYYKSKDYVSHNDNSGGIINSVYKIVRQYTLKQKLNLINSIYPQKGKILDVGCGTGLFLETCYKGGWTVSGVEPESTAREAAKKRLGKNISENLDGLGEDAVDVITMWHVLEHVADLQQTLRELNNRLKKGGTLLIALPNCDSLDARHFKQYWAAYDIPRHLSHFTPKTIHRTITNNGFEPLDTKPMYFDAFYISMLSTRHRDGKTKWIESVMQGIHSNREGSKTGNYSSLIYIYSKI